MIQVLRFTCMVLKVFLLEVHIKLVSLKSFLTLNNYLKLLDIMQKVVFENFYEFSMDMVKFCFLCFMELFPLNFVNSMFSLDLFLGRIHDQGLLVLVLSILFIKLSGSHVPLLFSLIVDL